MGQSPVDQPSAQPALSLLAAAVIVHDTATNRVLLLRRGEQAAFAQGMWDLPTGKTDPGESVTDTAVRELYEETGLIVEPEALKVVHIAHGVWDGDAPHGFLTVAYATHEWTGEPENREPGKHSELRWADAAPAALPAPFVPSTHAALLHYLSGSTDVPVRVWQRTT